MRSFSNKMAKVGNWVTCSSCDTEFRVVSESFYPIEYCPFCSSIIEEEDDDEEKEDEE